MFSRFAPKLFSFCFNIMFIYGGAILILKYDSTLRNYYHKKSRFKDFYYIKKT